MNRNLVAALLALLICGCGTADPGFVGIRTVDNIRCPRPAEDEEIMRTVLAEEIKASGSPETRYRSEDFDIVTEYLFPPQQVLPAGARIIRVAARQPEASDAASRGIAATVFVMPDRPVCWLGESVSSHGSCEIRCSVYDIWRRSELLVVIESSTSAANLSIRIALWNTDRNTIRSIWSASGMGNANYFCHSLDIRNGRLNLTVYGIYRMKAEDFEPARRELAKELGFPVYFIYVDLLI